jgi:ferredoxin
MNQQLTIEMREIAKKLLSSHTIGTVIGWEKGSRWYLTPPVFINHEEDIDRLHYDQFAVNNLAKYLLDYRYSDDKVAIFVKGCDSRGVVRLIQDHQLRKDQFIVIGIPCAGIFDKTKVTDPKQPHQLPLLDKCLECRYPNPVFADETLGGVSVLTHASKPTGISINATTAHLVGTMQEQRFQRVDELDLMTPEQKSVLWQSYTEKCLRCYACRNVCPACSCVECIFDADKQLWTSKAALLSGNSFFVVTKAMHSAGRCSECGECERVCPVGIPLMSLNKQLIKSINNIFGPYDAGVDAELPLPLSQLQLAEKPEV